MVTKIEHIEMTEEEITEFEELHGVTINEDGTIYDPLENRTFADVHSWKCYISEMDESLDLSNDSSVSFYTRRRLQDYE